MTNDRSFRNGVAASIAAVSGSALLVALMGKEFDAQSAIVTLVALYLFLGLNRFL